ncbi:MAG: IspD/TarI family cytidylyltransferase [Christensenellales bacterium]
MNFALIFAGGTGQRMNVKDMPKQFLPVHGKPIIIHTVDYFEQHEDINGICIVCVESHMDYMKALLNRYNIKKVKWLIPGGHTGEVSRYNGLNAIYADYGDCKDAVVLIHDGVRPLISKQIITDNIRAVHEHGNAITCAPIAETVVVRDEYSNLSYTVDRSKCRLARAPQSFFLTDIFDAYQSAINTKRDSIDSATLMYDKGMVLHLIEGPVENIKITTPLDYYLMRAIYDARESAIFG